MRFLHEIIQHYYAVTYFLEFKTIHMDSFPAESSVGFAALHVLKASSTDTSFDLSRISVCRGQGSSSPFAMALKVRSRNQPFLHYQGCERGIHYRVKYPYLKFFQSSGEVCRGRTRLHGEGVRAGAA